MQVIADAVRRPVEIYRRETPVVTDAPETDQSVWEAVDAQPAQPVAPIALLAKAASADRVVSAAVDGGSAAAVRLGPRSSCFAVVRAEQDVAPWLEALLENSVALHRARASATELADENDSFAMQLASDLEELTFLRSIVESLSSGQSDDNLVGMASATLPVLNASVQARCLAYLRLPRPADPYSAEVATVVGAEPCEYSVLELAVRRFGPGATRQPLVKNWGAADLPDFATALDDEQKLPGVRSLVVAPLASGTRMLGWLVAVNRAPSASAVHEASWQLASEEFGSGEATLIATTASILATHAANLDLLREKEQLMISMVRSLVSAIESKDAYTRGHSERVALYTRRLAEEIGYDTIAAENIYLAALLHDVGKIGVRDSVLKKEGRLTDEEYAEISRHPNEGWAILCDLDQLRTVLPGVLHHHERWDGQGYPDGLIGEAIPLDGRVMAVADAYDAMTSDRPYRKGMPTEKAETILREGTGVQWDPACIAAFFSCIEDIRRIKRDYQESDRKSREPQRRPGGQLPHEVAGLTE